MMEARIVEIGKGAAGELRRVNFGMASATLGVLVCQRENPPCLIFGPIVGFERGGAE
jgi:hypothetical protein